MAQCQYKTEKNRQCKLESGHEGQHKIMLPKKPLSDLLPKGFILKPERVKEGEALTKKSGRKTTGVRDADQRAMDKDALASYNAWEKAGKPDFMDKSKRHLYALNYEVPPKAVDGVLAYLRSATDSGSLLPGKQFRYTKGVAKSGNVLIQAGYIDKPPAKPITHVNATASA